MSNTIRAYAAMQAGEALQAYQFDAGELQAHQVESKSNIVAYAIPIFQSFKMTGIPRYILWWQDMKLLARLPN